MCGIWALFGMCDSALSHCGTSFPKISHRGPDAWRIEYDDQLKNCYIGFHRLTIVDCTYGMQPMVLHQYPKTMLCCNGELYNCKRLKDEFQFNYETFSDVECILHLYNNYGIEACAKNLDGVFAILIVDVANRKLFLARDPYGVRPLFKLTTTSGTLGVCSEAKGLVGISQQLNGEGMTLEPFPPGTYEEYKILEDGKVELVDKGIFHKAGYKPSFTPYIPYEDIYAIGNMVENIKNLLIKAVEKRLMSDRRIGCLLSGGLDSSLVAAILVKLAKDQNIPYKVQSFSIGMGDSPDVLAARQVAAHIGTEHYEIIFTEKDVADILDEVIYTLETPDITTVRASIPMYLISKYIKEHTDTTVVFSGEGADEVAQGYIYFRDAPSDEAAHEDSKRILDEIYLFDGLRADRTMASQSLELRVPFLDQQFVHYYLSLPKHAIRPRDGVEKYLIRSAFDSTDFLPKHILWRHKEAFSDGVTSRNKTLFQVLQEIVDKRMPGPFNPKAAAEKYPHCTPKTKEAYYYREIFEKHFPKFAEKCIPYYWMPRWTDAEDPSARFIKHYKAETQTNVKV